ncbi:MAG: hypothetical protein E3K32_12930 [wastewater metagenome]|nr:hypothetical protein [Candidatus Loosdrechtia aerotolerans]
MDTLFYKNFSVKKFFISIAIALTVGIIAVQRDIPAEGQTKYNKDFFDSIEPIKLRDPLAVTLGVMNNEEAFLFTYADAVKYAGHSCPAVAGAYKSTQMALKSLYGEEVPVRGNIKVVFKGGVDYKVNGPISQVVTFITGASGENGFRGFGTAGKYGRYNKMTFQKDQMPDPEAICSILFERTDTGKKVEVTYSIMPVPVNERIDKLMPRVISGKASEDESKEFGSLWQDRVKAILVNPPEGTFIVKELKE